MVEGEREGCVVVFLVLLLVVFLLREGGKSRARVGRQERGERRRREKDAARSVECFLLLPRPKQRRAQKL